ncbi:alkaline phosphatase family protein [Marivirga sp. S37H4]|uniref:Alkaline phosphatase family protein n=1 Tax=Marivirga aurantiaca TaxID=2802615 RepID=A0A934WV40_9BACT|nr:ectonucleotide pyrophosphatase/phosphodiesterase [Marivirga aurantiaca]MBK6263573.1 alkaline phosphatase family protein [Marivirga aurantiaca]
MKNLTLICLLILCFFTSIAQESKKQHVILISIDGLRPDFYLDKKWPAPILQHMAEVGSHAEAVKGIFPSVTYPSHTTMVTGNSPAKHGIYYNAPFEPQGATGEWYWEYESIQSPTLFSLVKEAGLKSGAISWPVTVGAPIDYNLPEIWSLDKNEDRFAPLRKFATPKGFVEEIETKAIGKINNNNFGNDGYFAREQKFAAAASYIFETYQPDLLAVHLIAADHFQHTDGREGYMVERAVSAVDVAIGQIVETVERLGMMEQTTFIISGDHGFVDIHSVLSPNVWLKEAGLISGEEKGAPFKAKFHTSGAAAFLHLNDPKDKKSVEKVNQILNDLPANYKKLFRVLDKNEMAEVGADPNAFVGLAPIEGIAMSSSVTGEALKKGSGGTHGFYPDNSNIYTGFVAYGASIKKGVVLKEMSLVDIAPLIIKLLKLPETETEGIFYPGIIE